MLAADGAYDASTIWKGGTNIISTSSIRVECDSRDSNEQKGVAIGSLVGGLKIVVNENFIFDFSIVDFFRKEVKIARKVNRFSRALLNVKSSKKAPLKPKIFTEIWFGKKPVGLVLYALISQHRTIPLFFFLPEKAFVAPDVISIIFFKIRVKYWFLRKNS